MLINIIIMIIKMKYIITEYLEKVWKWAFEIAYIIEVFCWLETSFCLCTNVPIEGRLVGVWQLSWWRWCRVRGQLVWKWWQYLRWPLYIWCQWNCQALWWNQTHSTHHQSNSVKKNSQSYWRLLLRQSTANPQVLHDNAQGARIYWNA